MWTVLLLFKGTQFFSGLLLALYESYHLWKCAVLSDPPACGSDAPGSHRTITSQVLLLLESQSLVALSLYLAYLRTSSFSVRALIMRQLSHVEQAFTRWVLGAAWLLGAMANSEAEAEEFGLWRDDDNDDGDDDDGDGDSKDDGGGGEDEAGVADEESGDGDRFQSGLGAPLLEAWLQPPVVQPPPASHRWFGTRLDALGTSLLACRRRVGQWVRERPVVDRAVSRAMAQRATADQDDNDAVTDDGALHLDVFSSVFFWLLLWDSTACFLFITTLFGSIEGAGTGYGWRARQTYVVLYSFFQLSALPFIPFSLAAKLGSTAGLGPRTGFNRHGLCVPVNTEGLSAFCIWTRRVLSRWSLKRTLPVTDRKSLKKEAKRLIAYTEAFPFAQQGQAARKTELRARLDTKLRAALAASGVSDPHTHGVYRSVFPNESVIAMYERRNAKRVKEERDARIREFGAAFRRRGGAGVAAVRL